MVRVKACTGCRKYIIIRPESVENRQQLKEFEDTHRGHTMVSVELSEVQGKYENVGKKEEE